jgi:hypothetical protein
LRLCTEGGGKLIFVKNHRRKKLLSSLLFVWLSLFCPPGVALDRERLDLENCALVLGTAFTRRRVLLFPSDYSLGEIVINECPRTSISKELRGAAKGTVVVPPNKMCKFIPSYHFYKNPGIVKTLPPDGFDSILMAASSMDDAEDGLCDRALASIGHLKGLVELQLDKSDATDLGAAHAADLPNLQRISAFSAALEGKCFQQFSGLKHLLQLRLARNPLKDETLQYLGSIPQLQFLNINRCNVSDEGVRHLADCSQLLCLNIGDNPKVTDQSIKYLLRIKKLRTLFIGGTSITAKGLLQLKALPLRALDFSSKKFTALEIKEIRKDFAGVLLVPDIQKKAVDSETNSLFAPLH